MWHFCSLPVVNHLPLTAPLDPVNCMHFRECRCLFLLAGFVSPWCDVQCTAALQLHLVMWSRPSLLQMPLVSITTAFYWVASRTVNFILGACCSLSSSSGAECSAPYILGFTFLSALHQPGLQGNMLLLLFLTLFPVLMLNQTKMTHCQQEENTL